MIPEPQIGAGREMSLLRSHVKRGNEMKLDRVAGFLSRISDFGGRETCLLCSHAKRGNEMAGGVESVFSQ